MRSPARPERVLTRSGRQAGGSRNASSQPARFEASWNTRKSLKIHKRAMNPTPAEIENGIPRKASASMPPTTANGLRALFNRDKDAHRLILLLFARTWQDSSKETSTNGSQRKASMKYSWPWYESLFSRAPGSQTFVRLLRAELA
jgi:hypothetical protein